jgi:antibiotic biosynthesis monooxygenase (ABM) superfamily enzyme
MLIHLTLAGHFYAGGDSPPTTCNVYEIYTPLMTYIFLPVTTQLLRPWLQKPRKFRPGR